MTYDVSDYGKCESCDQYNRVLESGFCVGCIWTLMMDVNNIKEMRKALEFIKLASDDYEKYGSTKAGALDVIYEKACAALAKPPRNCDVGTSDDQGERFKNFCRNHQFISVDSEDGFPPVHVCSNESCPLHGYYIAHGEDNCELAWAQMPYESQNGKG